MACARGGSRGGYLTALCLLSSSKSGESNRKPGPQETGACDIRLAGGCSLILCCWPNNHRPEAEVWDSTSHPMRWSAPCQWEEQVRPRPLPSLLFGWPETLGHRELGHQALWWPRLGSKGRRESLAELLLLCIRRKWHAVRNGPGGETEKVH